MPDNIFDYLYELKEKQKQAYNDFLIYDRMKRGGYINYITSYYDLAEGRYKKLTNEIEKVNSKIEENSKFNPSEIGPVIARLISEFSDTNYLYRKYCVRMTEPFISASGEDDTLIFCNTHMIFPENEKYTDKVIPMGFSPEDALKRWYPGAIRLGYELDTESEDYEVKFYDSNLRQLIDVSEFDFVYEFIDYVINDRINNYDKKIDSQRLDMLLEEFIKIKKNNISSESIKRLGKYGKKD